MLCGLLDGVTTGAPLCAIIENTNQRSKDYSSLRVLPRPGHADYTAYVKYGKPPRRPGGGHFSGRLTAPLVFAGAIARQLLQRRGILVASHVASIGEAQDQPFDPVSIPPQLLERLAGEYFPVIDAAAKERMRQVVEAAPPGRRQRGRRGGVRRHRPACGGGGAHVRRGGEPHRLPVLCIPAMKGIEFGAGFDAARRRGSQNNDPFYYDAQGQVKTRTNHAGGILGGITNGMPLVFRAAFKPTPSIAQEQDTVNLETGQNATLSIPRPPRPMHCAPGRRRRRGRRLCGRAGAAGGKRAVVMCGEQNRKCEERNDCLWKQRNTRPGSQSSGKR